MSKYHSFDLEAFLIARGHDFLLSGRNISPGCLGIPCPFCGGKGHHMGVFKTSKNFSCWQCAKKGSLPLLIKQLEGCSWPVVYEFIKQYSDPNAVLEYEPQVHQGGVLKWPFGMTPGLNKKASAYLRGRNFDPDMLATKYDLRCTGPVGDASFRIIIPIIQDRTPVSWIGADYTRRSEDKYLNAHSQDSVVPARQCWYNLDNTQKDGFAMIVEGVTDCWRMGDGAVAALGKAITANQISQLVQKKIERVAIVLDDDATKMAEEFAALLAPIFKVKMVLLEDGDPAEFTDREAMQLKIDLLQGEW